MYHTLPREPLVCPGVPNPAYSDELDFLVRNHTNNPLVADPKITITYLHLILADKIAGYRACSLMRDLSLPNPAINVALSPLNVNLPPSNHDEAIALLEEYTDLFSASPHGFGLLKGTSYYLEPEDIASSNLKTNESLKLKKNM